MEDENKQQFSVMEDEKFIDFLTDKFSGIHQEIKDIRHDIKDIRYDITDIQADNKGINQNIEEIQADNKGIHQEIRGMRQDIREIQVDNKGIHQEIKDINQKIDGQKEILDLLLDSSKEQFDELCERLGFVEGKVDSMGIMEKAILSEIKFIKNELKKGISKEQYLELENRIGKLEKTVFMK